MDILKSPAQELVPFDPCIDQRKAHSDTELITSLIDSIISQFDLALDRTEQVTSDCLHLQAALDACPSALRREHLTKLLPLLRKKAGATAAAVFSLLESAALSTEDAWPLLEGMLAARDRGLVRRALELALRCARSGTLHLSRDAIQFLAEQAECEDSILGDPPALSELSTILNECLTSGQDGVNPLLALCLTPGSASIRRLAAKLLDLDGQLPTPQLAGNLLGADSYSFLRPYLEYTRASHFDLLQIVTSRGGPFPVMDSLRRAEEVCGEPLL